MPLEFIDQDKQDPNAQAAEDDIDDIVRNGQKAEVEMTELPNTNKTDQGLE